MAICDTLDHANVPQDLVRAVARQAEKDACRVVEFLDILGFNTAGPNATPIPLSPWLLLGLGASLRLLAWECNGSRGLLNVYLPSALEATRGLFVAAADRREPGQLASLARELAFRVFKVWVDHFAWHGPEAMGADLVLGDAAEDALADVLARFLWNQRHASTWEGEDV